MAFHLGYCAVCKSDSQKVVVSLHGDQGGPLVCHICLGKWHAEHGRKRRAGRVVIRAMMAYLDVGGHWHDVEKLKDSALFGFGSAPWENLDPLGYMADAINTDGESTDLTSELLDDAIRLTHPDCRPPERQELAKSVTQKLLALKPFAFPAPAPRPRDDSVKGFNETFKDALQAIAAYPCKECKSTIPVYYCTPCRAEYDKRYKIERDHLNAKQREQYARRKARKAWRNLKTGCAACGAEFKGKRKDAKFCSSACRQKNHRTKTPEPSNGASNCLPSPFPPLPTGCVSSPL
jgi:hypothetical protein